MTEISIADIEGAVARRKEHAESIPQRIAGGCNVILRDYTKADIAEYALRDLLDYDVVTDLDLSHAVLVAAEARTSAAAIAVCAARHLANVMCTGLDRVTDAP